MMPATMMHESIGRIGKIPVRNIWLLMLYASDLYRVVNESSVAVEEDPEHLPALAAEILADAVERRRHRQLNASYVRVAGVLNRVRGRIDVLTTERRQLLAQAKVACRYETLTVDTIRNRLVRGALEKLVPLLRRQDESMLALRCRNLSIGLREAGVTGALPSRAEISRVRFSRNDADDRIMVAAARLALDLALPTEQAGIEQLPVPDRDEAWARNLFEKAVGGFYRVALKHTGWSVRTGQWLNWQLGDTSDAGREILPKMQTDIVLENRPQQQRIVIDTKFTALLRSGNYNNPRVHSGYLYQMYAYLRSQCGGGDALAECASGVLLHPAVGYSLNEFVEIQGHRIHFSTVDLAGQANEIRSELLALVNLMKAGF